LGGSVDHSKAAYRGSICVLYDDRGDGIRVKKIPSDREGRSEPRARVSLGSCASAELLPGGRRGGEMLFIKKKSTGEKARISRTEKRKGVWRKPMLVEDWKKSSRRKAGMRRGISPDPHRLAGRGKNSIAAGLGPGFNPIVILGAGNITGKR